MNYATVAAIMLVFAASASAEVRHVAPDGNLQEALNAAQPGDVIQLQAGAVYRGTFVLPAKAGLVTVRSSATLPDRRIGPDDAALVAYIASSCCGASALEGPGTTNWRFEGVGFHSNPNGENNIVWLDGAQNVTFDRTLIVSGPNGQRRAMALNGRHLTVTRSYIGNIFWNGESAAIGIWNGAGPYTLTDNYLEAAGMSVLIGGAGSSSVDHNPSDILVQGNVFTKNLAWKGNAGITVKNCFELKNAARVKVFDNVCEHVWSGQGQDGSAVLFTVMNDGNDAPWVRVEDVEFARNTFRDVEHGFNINGHDYAHPALQTTRISIHDNTGEIAGNLLKIGGEAGVVSVTNNPNLHYGGFAALLYAGDVWTPDLTQPRPAKYAVESFTFQNNAPGEMFGDGVGTGQPAIDRYVVSFNGSNAPPPPPPDPCVVAPIQFAVTAWPTRNQKTQARFEVSSPRTTDVTVSFKFKGNQSESALASDGLCTKLVER